MQWGVEMGSDYHRGLACQCRTHPAVGRKAGSGLRPQQTIQGFCLIFPRGVYEYGGIASTGFRNPFGGCMQSITGTMKEAYPGHFRLRFPAAFGT